MQRIGRALTRDQVLETLWSQDYIGDARTVDVHVRWAQGEDRGRSGASHPYRDRARGRLPVRRVRVPRSLHWRIAAAYTALIFVTMGAVSIFLINFVNDRFVEDLEDRLLREANLIGQTPGIFKADEATNAAVDGFGRSIQGHVTVFDAGGVAVADSAGPSGPDVPVRPEITEALGGRATSFVRSAEAFGGNELRYATVPVEVGGSLTGVVRVGVPTSTVTARVNTIIMHRRCRRSSGCPAVYRAGLVCGKKDHPLDDGGDRRGEAAGGREP